MWSFEERDIVARAEGHSSWLSSVAFDPLLTYVCMLIDLGLAFLFRSHTRSNNHIEVGILRCAVIVSFNFSVLSPPSPTSTFTAVRSTVEMPLHIDSCLWAKMGNCCFGTYPLKYSGRNA